MAQDADATPGNGTDGLPGSDAIADQLRIRIQNSDLVDGEWLREARLCSEFGVGRSTVRRALGILSDDGLIELAENRGARVRSTSVEEVFDLYEVRAALYGLAARFACLRGSDGAVRRMLVAIDQLLEDSVSGRPAEQIITASEAIFTQMAACASVDTQRMIVAVRRKTRFHFSYAALALHIRRPGPFDHWRRVRSALARRDANEASQASRDILYFMQEEVVRIMLAHGSRRDGPPATESAPEPARRAAGRKARS